MDNKCIVNKGDKELKISFDINTINHLGVKLYSTIPPMIAELVSNAWDADAKNVYISFSEGESKCISVRDDGQGMSFDELNTQFLKVGRNRRTELNNDVTSSGRMVLGKKGVGKLSMFGIGKRITVSSVKNGQKNSFVMDYDEIKKCNEETYKPQILVFEERTSENNGTTILIESITKKSDFDVVGLRRSLQSRFHIYSDDFVIHINNDPALKIAENELPEDKYQFLWEFPKDFELDFDAENANLSSLLEFAKKKKILGKIYTASTPLRKEVQGIVLFSRGKLVQEHKSFNIRGNDNFFQYMSGSFDVDFVDADKEVDNCSTDRKSLAWDSFETDDLRMLNDLMEKIVSITQKKWRGKRKEEKKRKVEKLGQDLDKWLETLNSVEKPLAKKLTNAIIDNDNIGDDTAAEYIKCIKDMYGFESFKQFTLRLDELQELDNESAIKLLTDWHEIEAKEYAKIAIGRIKTIEQFEKFIRTNASERDVIQKFLEEFPWLLDPKMAKFEREVTYTNLLKRTFCDDFLPETNRRIDFLCTDSSGIIHVIELKRPNIKLTMKEIQQIVEYVEFIKKQFPDSTELVKGYLISDNMTFEPGSETIRKGLEGVGIFVKSYSDLLAEARRYNKDMYDLYTKIDEVKKDK